MRRKLHPLKTWWLGKKQPIKKCWLDLRFMIYWTMWHMRCNNLKIYGIYDFWQWFHASTIFVGIKCCRFSQTTSCLKKAPGTLRLKGPSKKSTKKNPFRAQLIIGRSVMSSLRSFTCGKQFSDTSPRKGRPFATQQSFWSFHAVISQPKYPVPTVRPRN